ncbi:hypothetical protein PFISCL1PPCAC_15802 [Pristionchus fissidentatus]|uniref:Uncharacterized protein n=1 Tax=Pristionchus fissidentatus TaxID=1538716 RepID=A0AAV5W1B0_9BILA|nr:hypothetical protein PFISCL1PPCAC_15802 [Pristionchus fissidentatus]
MDESGEEVDPDSAPFFIRVVQMAGELEEEKVFLLPALEEPRRLIRPTRMEQPMDAWSQLLQMSHRLSRALQRHVKLRGSNLRKECRELINVIETFLKTAED